MIKSYINNWLFFLLFISAVSLSGQNETYFTPELSIGISAASNENFPDRNLQLQGLLHFTKSNLQTDQEWAQWLNRPQTGITLGYTNFGNNGSLGSAYSILPFLEFNNFKSTRWTTMIGLGGSYFTKKFDPIANFDNRAVATDITWSFKAFTYYTFLKRSNIHWRAGLGLFHHSNGHTRLPNNGYNSFLVSLSAQINPTASLGPSSKSKRPVRTRYNYLTARTGVGQNVFNDGDPFNNKKEVYTISGEYGKVFNKTLRLGIGAFYRVYEHYYDYINDNEFLVRDGERFASLRENPWNNASNIALYTRGELLLNHIGIELMLGVNLHKPAYQIDWYLNEGWDFAPREIPDVWVFGEFNSKYKLKEIFTTRLGLNYYLKGTDTFTKHNLVAGIHLNTNLGQADFTEVSIGYVYSFGLKEKKRSS